MALRIEISHRVDGPPRVRPLTCRPRAVRRILRQQVERDLDRFTQLAVVAASVVLWLVINLDIRVGAVVLHAPADVVEEERELWLGDHRPVHEAMAWPDADHTAPGALADEWPELHQLE